MCVSPLMDPITKTVSDRSFSKIPVLILPVESDLTVCGNSRSGCVVSVGSVPLKSVRRRGIFWP